MKVIRKEQALEVWKHVDIVVAGGGPAGVGEPYQLHVREKRCFFLKNGHTLEAI